MVCLSSSKCLLLVRAGARDCLLTNANLYLIHVSSTRTPDHRLRFCSFASLVRAHLRVPSSGVISLVIVIASRSLYGIISDRYRSADLSKFGQRQSCTVSYSDVAIVKIGFFFCMIFFDRDDYCFGIASRELGL